MQMTDDIVRRGVYGDDNDDQTASFSAGTGVTPATMYPGSIDVAVAAAIAAVVAGSGAAVFVDMRYEGVDTGSEDASAYTLKRTGARPIRVNLSMGIKESDAAAATVDENGYLVVPMILGTTRGIRLERAYTAVWARSADQANQIPTGSGGRTGLCWPSSVTLSNTGLLLARTGAEIARYDQVPAFATIRDVGNAVGILRVMDNGATVPDGYVPIHDVWR